MYCFSIGLYKISDIARECRTNNILRVATCGKTPSINVLRRFLYESDSLVLKKIFLYSIVKLNDLDFIHFLKFFIDGTDAIIHGSRNYTITREDIEGLKFMKKEGLLHNNRKKSKTTTYNKLKQIQNDLDKNSELYELIEQIFLKFDIYNKNIYKNIKLFESIMDERNLNYVSIVFPESVMMKTKKGGFDFAFNLQEIMIDNKIILMGLLLDKPNDHYSLEEIIQEIKENTKILIELQEKYGQRNNYKEIQQIIEKALYICDSGYFTTENIETADKHGMNFLIMPKLISNRENNKNRRKHKLKTKDKNKQNKNKESKKSLKRVYNGYICKKGQKIELTETIKVKKRVNIRKGIPEQWQEYRYIHQCSKSEQCPHHSECPFKTITDNYTPLEYEMINKFTNQRYHKLYKDRFHCSEGINGYLKSINGTIILSGHNATAVKNELQIHNVIYNLQRMINLKETIY